MRDAKPWIWLAIGIVALLAICAATPVYRAQAATCHGQIGEVSWYGTESGSRTATGEHFNGTSMTMAVPRRSMIGKRYRVTDLRTGRSVVVRANDLGPAAWTHRIGDLSRAAAERLGIVHAGTARVCLSPL